MKLQTKNPLVNEFMALVAQGIECWSKAGEIIVKMIDDDGMTIAEIAESSDMLTEDIVTRFEQLGRKQIVPNLLVADYPAARHMIRLPYSEQKRVVENSVELLVSGAETLRVAVENLTPSQCRQVFDKNHVRSIAAQRAYLEERKSNEAREVVECDPIYQVRGRKVIIRRPCEMSAGQLAQIIAEIESK